MQTNEALRTVLEMAHRSYSKSFGPAEHEHEALWIVENMIEDSQEKEQEAHLAMYNRNRAAADQAKTYGEMIQRVRRIAFPDCNSLDAQEIDRHAGLEIGPDGTVTEVK